MSHVHWLLDILDSLHWLLDVLNNFNVLDGLHWFLHDLLNRDFNILVNVYWSFDNLFDFLDDDFLDWSFDFSDHLHWLFYDLFDLLDLNDFHRDLYLSLHYLDNFLEYNLLYDFFNHDRFLNNFFYLNDLLDNLNNLFAGNLNLLLDVFDLDDLNRLFDNLFDLSDDDNLDRLLDNLLDDLHFFLDDGDWFLNYLDNFCDNWFFNNLFNYFNLNHWFFNDFLNNFLDFFGLEINLLTEVRLLNVDLGLFVGLRDNNLGGVFFGVGARL